MPMIGGLVCCECLNRLSANAKRNRIKFGVGLRFGCACRRSRCHACANSPMVQSSGH
jgi:hypothetical protein